MKSVAAILTVAAALDVDCNLPDGAGGFLVYAGKMEEQCCGALMQKVAGGVIKLGQGAALPGCLSTMFKLTGGACVDGTTNPAFTVVGNRSLVASDYGKYPTDASWTFGMITECKDSRMCTASYTKAIMETYPTKGSLHAAMGGMLADMADATCPTISKIPTSPSTVVGPISCEPIPGAINFGTQDSQCCEHMSAMVVANALADPAGQAATTRCFAHGPDGCVTSGPLAGKMPNNTEIAAAIGTVCAAPPGACGTSSIKALRDNVGAMNPILLAGLDKNNDNVTDLCVRTCLRPSASAAYDFSAIKEASLASIAIMGGAVTGITCGKNYLGTPVVAPCAETGTAYVVGGCTIDPVAAYYDGNALCTTYGSNDGKDNSGLKVTKAGSEVTCGSIKSSTSKMDAMLYGGVCCAAVAAPTEITEKSICTAGDWDKKDRSGNAASVACMDKDSKAVDMSAVSAWVDMGKGFNTTGNAALCTDAATGNTVKTLTCGDVYKASKETAFAMAFAGRQAAAALPYACCEGPVVVSFASSGLSVISALAVTLVLALLH